MGKVQFQDAYKNALFKIDPDIFTLSINNIHIPLYSSSFLKIDNEVNITIYQNMLVVTLWCINGNKRAAPDAVNVDMSI